MTYIIVDIDGTVALHVEKDGTLRRGHHEYERVNEDSPHWPIISLVQALCRPRLGGIPLDLVFVSGRPERCREDTDQWLADYITGTQPNHLFMRKDGDHRADDVVKAEIFDNEVAPMFGDEPFIVLDDRPRVIRMWAARGFTVLDVNPTSGEF